MGSSGLYWGKWDNQGWLRRVKDTQSWFNTMIYSFIAMTKALSLFQLVHNLFFLQYMFDVKIDGENYWTIENTVPAIFAPVSVYAGDQWYQPVSGQIRNLRVQILETTEVTTEVSEKNYEVVRDSFGNGIWKIF